jgi:hypothetical protein
MAGFATMSATSSVATMVRCGTLLTGISAATNSTGTKSARLNRA